MDEVIEAIGGDGAAQELAGVGPSAVSNWRARGKISQENFFRFAEVLRAKGKEADPAVFGFKAIVDEARA